MFLANWVLLELNEVQWGVHLFNEKCKGRIFLFLFVLFVALFR